MSDNYPTTEAMKCAVEMEIGLALMTTTVAKGRVIDSYLEPFRAEITRLNGVVATMGEALTMIACGTEDQDPPYRSAPAEKLREMARAALKAARGEG